MPATFHVSAVECRRTWGDGLSRDAQQSPLSSRLVRVSFKSLTASSLNAAMRDASLHALHCHHASHSNHRALCPPCLLLDKSLLHSISFF